jgi:type IV secretory pathway VirB10-like protein
MAPLGFQSKAKHSKSAQQTPVLKDTKTGKDEAEIRSPAPEAASKQDDGEIVCPEAPPPPRHQIVPASPPKTPEDPGKTDQKKPKRTLLQVSREEPEDSCKKAKTTATEKKANTFDKADQVETPEKVSPYNRRRDTCEICGVKRTATQRGCACPTCLQILRKTCGHQSVSKLKEEASLLQQVKESSLEAQEEAHEEAIDAVPGGKRMRRIEAMLQKILQHLGLD